MLSYFSPVALSVRQYVVKTFFVVNANAAKMSLVNFGHWHFLHYVCR